MFPTHPNSQCSSLTFIYSTIIKWVCSEFKGLRAGNIHMPKEGFIQIIKNGWIHLFLLASMGQRRAKNQGVSK